MLNCSKCNSINIIKNGTEIRHKKILQKYKCKQCKHNFSKSRDNIIFKKLSDKEQMKLRYFDSGIENIGYIDIETDGQLKGDFGEVISAVLFIRNVKTDKIKKYRWLATKKEVVTLDGDKRIIKELLKKFKECDLIIGHYSSGWKKFDIPFLRTRANMLKLKFPIYGTLKYGDTWNLAHVLNLQSYRLESVCEALRIPNVKTRFDPKTWKLSRHGNKQALNKIMDHNYKDVVMLLGIHKKLELLNPIPSSKM